jgi:hypothetical protein
MIEIRFHGRGGQGTVVASKILADALTQEGNYVQALSGVAERNDDIIYVCYDNEAYMNTGIQRSSATPWGAWTTTTPVKHYKDKPKKDMEAIMAAHRIPYIATASVGYPEDLFKKVKKAKDIEGTRFIHIFAPCPAGSPYRHRCSPFFGVEPDLCSVGLRQKIALLIISSM